MQRLPRDHFEALVREHHAAVYRSAARWVGDHGAADVTQDVFVRVLEGKVRLEAAHSVRATLCWLATRLAANDRRSRLRRSRHEETAMRADPNPADDRSPDHEDPARRAADAEAHRAVAAVVQTLPDELRLPLQMHCQDELTFAAIGTALRVPTSTAHDRVQQALQRVRTALAGRGLAFAAAQVPELIARVDATAPSGLQTRLLALGESTAVSAGIGARLLLGALAAATTVAVALVAWWPNHAEPLPRREAAAVATAAAVGQDPAASGSPGPADRSLVTPDDIAAGAPARAEPPLPTGTIELRTTSIFHGTVHDVGAWPVAHTTVEAIAAGGLKAFPLGSTSTDAQGAFRLEIGPHSLYPDAVRLRIVEGGHLLLETDELPLPREASEAALTLVLPATAGTALSRYELRVTVVDAHGLPLPDAPVALFAAGDPPPRPDGGSEPEARATSGGDGIAPLRGRVLGTKWLFVDGRPSGHGSHFAPIELARTGAHEARVVLPAGGRLEVHVATFAGERLEWANVWLEDEASGLSHRAELAADGTAVFTALGGGTHTLHVSAGTDLSLVRRRGLRAGDGPIELRIKRRDDLRDVGDHQAELHGELVDAATGEVVAFGAFAVTVLPMRAGTSSLPSDCVEPPAPAQQLDLGGSSRSFHEVDLGAGRWAVLTDVPGYAPSVVEVELRDGEMRTGMRIPLQRGGELRGRVVDADGEPVSGARVFPLGTGDFADRCLERWRTLRGVDLDRLPEPTQPCTVAYTDTDGTFVLRRVPPGIELRLLAHQRERGAAVTAPLMVRAGEVQAGIDLRFDGR